MRAFATRAEPTGPCKMTDTHIICPNCGYEIPISEALSAQIRGELESSLSADHDALLKRPVAGMSILIDARVSVSCWPSGTGRQVSARRSRVRRGTS